MADTPKAEEHAPDPCNMLTNPLEVIQREHDLQERMCDALELIADELPGVFNRALLTTLLSALKHDFAVHVRDEERGLFPLLRKRALAEDNLDSILAQLEAEHAQDQGYAAEIVTQFEQMTVAGRVENPNMLGYMLRGFFETQRRHLLWENTVLLPIAHARLGQEDLKELARVMIENRRSGPRTSGQTLFEAF